MRTRRVAQCAEERDDRSTLGTREMERVGAERLIVDDRARTAAAATVIEAKHLVERPKSAIVHVRRGLGNVPQGRRLEGAKMHW